MSKSIATPAQELLNTQTNAGDQINQNSSELVHREVINGTPFHVVGNNDRGYFIALGIYRITEIKPSINEAIDLLKTDMWNILIRVVTTTHEQVLNAISEQNNLQTKMELK